jgi:flagellar motility protein MotE (MotC chaperone)
MSSKVIPYLVVLYALVLLVKINVFVEKGSVFPTGFFLVDSLKATKAMAVEHPAEDEKNGEVTEKEQIPADPVVEISNVSKEKPVDAINFNSEFTDVEIDLLKTLSKRREQLNAWTLDAKSKENILKATEIKIDRKLAALKDLKTEVEGLLKIYNEKENEKINSLVKIYENMKPKDAALIFEKLDMEVLLQVINKMKEGKIASILAKVTPGRAEAITIEYAENRRIQAKGRLLGK